MVKYDSLYGNQKSKLHKLYADAVQPEPQQPEDKTLPKLAPSQVVRGQGEARIYAEVAGIGDGFRRSAGEVRGRLVFTDGKENHKLEVAVEELDTLIAELQRIKADVEAVNDVLRTNSTAQKDHREVMEQYEQKRHAQLTKKLANGRITVEMIDAAEEWADLKS